MKRKDIQGIRAFAILLVLGYHVYPVLVPNGYVGVDIFFVISGYLIARMLSNSAGIFDLKSTFAFYFRRFKRILPMFYFVVFSCILYTLGTQNLPYAYKRRNYVFTKRTVYLISNWRGRSEKDTYEQQLIGGHTVLAHCWSLCLEMQFYLISPLLIAFINKFKGDRRLIAIWSLIVLSFRHFVVSSHGMRFNCPIARLWQFAFGFLAFYMETESGCSSVSEYKDNNKQSYYKMECVRLIEELEENDIEKQILQFYKAGNILAFSLLLVTLYSRTIPQTLLRLLITPATSVLIFTGSRHQHQVLSNRITVYIGDISYSLYLVHWPLRCFVGYYMENHLFGEMTWSEPVLLLSLAIAIILHHGLEKPLQVAHHALNIIFVLIFFFGSVYLMGTYFHKIEQFRMLNSRYLTSSLNEHFNRAIGQNLEMVTNTGLRRHLRIFNCTPETVPGFELQPCIIRNGLGNLSILVTGNSYVANHGDTIIKHLLPLASSIITYWKSACEVIAPPGQGICKSDEYPYPKYMEFVEKMRPDILILTSRAVVMNQNIRGSSVHDDRIFQFMHSRIMRLQKWTNRIFILGPNADSPSIPATVCLERLRCGVHLSDVNPFVNKPQIAFRQRLELVVSLCEKCEVYEWEHLFFNKTINSTQFFDAKNDFVYFDDMIHLGKHGIKKIQPIYKQLASRIRELFY